MQIGNKRTTLKDDAALYSHESDKLTEKEKFRSLKGRKKWIQFRDYYLLKVIAIVAVLAFIVSLLYTVFSPKPETVFYAAIGDFAVDPERIDEIREDFNTYISLDTETQETTFDDGFFFMTDSYAATQKFAVYLAVGQISVAVVPQSVFEKMAPNGFFKPMSEVLPTELYLTLSDRFVMSGTNDDKGEVVPNSEKAYGIVLDGSRYYTDYSLSEPVVLCVCSTWGNNDVCVDFIEFLLK